MRLTFLGFWAGFFLLANATFAQQINFQGKLTAQAQAAWDQFQQQHGNGWQITIEPDTGYVSSVLGKSIAPSRPLQREADFVAEAIKVIAANASLFGVTAAHLQQKKFVKADLARFGGVNKYSVQFAQSYQHIPVEASSFVVVFTEDGRCVDMSAHIIANVERVNLNQILESAEAQSLAADDFFARHQTAAQSVSIPQLKIIATEVAGKQVPRLAWLVECRSDVIQNGLPLAEEFALAADNRQLEVLRIKNLIHTSNIIGKVTGLVTPGTAPDTSANPAVEIPLENLKVTSSDGLLLTAYTQANGDFVFLQVNAPALISAGVNGLFASIVNVQGPNTTISDTLIPDQTKTVTFNLPANEQTTAELNAYYWINTFRNWYLNIDPYFDPLGFRVAANVNLKGSCNAFYAGTSVNFYRAGGGCANAAYSSIIVHELGHWINDIEGSGNGSDGFGEGSADAWSMYILDDPIVGKDFQGINYVRSGENTRQFCGDNNGGCYGEVHKDGEVLMGAIWKVRQAFKASYTDIFSLAYTNALLVAWYEAYDDYRIHTEIRDHWLVLSDDDADLANGTPYCAQIEAGFAAHGFPASGFCGGGVDPLNIYVDFRNISGTENGSFPFPFNTVVEGINAATIGGNVLILAGTYNGNLIKDIQKNVTLHAVNGSITIQ